MTDNDWCVAVFRCKQEGIRDVLLDFYSFMKDVEGVKSLHFLIRDRIRSDIVVCFRVLTEQKSKEIIRSKMRFKLGGLVPDKFAVDPDSRHPLKKYVAWNVEERTSEVGVQKFSEFCDILSKMSDLVIQMLKNDYFKSDERTEIAHIMSWMLGCTEYGLMSPTHWEVGYYDRIEDKRCPYLKQNFPQTQKTET
jgi:hypothetical protein